VELQVAGPERDRQVAEIRGDDFECGCTLGATGRCPADDIQGFSEDDCMDDCKYMKPNIKPYSTDISAAMELLPELIEAGYLINVQQNLSRDATSSTAIYNTQIVMQSGGKDAVAVISDTISGAYLKLKGGSKWSR